MDRRVFLGKAGVFVLAAFAGCSGSSGSNEVVEETTSTPTPTTSTTTTFQTTTQTQEDSREVVPAPSEVPAYEVIQKEDVSYAGAIRISVHVKTKIDVMDLSKSDFLAITQDVVHKATSGTEVNAISVAFWREKATVGRESSFANVDWAPRGKWGDASTVDAGDYSTHEYTLSAPAVFEVLEFSAPNEIEMGTALQPKLTVKNTGLDSGPFRAHVDIAVGYQPWTTLSVFETEIQAGDKQEIELEPIHFDSVPDADELELRLKISELTTVRDWSVEKIPFKITGKRLDFGDTYSSPQGEAITVDNVQLQDRYSYSAYDGDIEYESAPSGKQYVFITSRVENKGDNSQYVNGTAAYSLVTDEEKYDSAFLTWKDEGELELKELSPGQKSSGWVVFEVPSLIGRSDIQIEFKSPATSEQFETSNHIVYWG